MLCIIGGSDAISCILELSYMISTNCRAGSLADLPLVVKLIHQLNQPLYITNYNIRQNTCSWVEALAFCFDRNHLRCYSLPGIMCSAPICLFPQTLQIHKESDPTPALIVFLCGGNALMFLNSDNL